MNPRYLILALLFTVAGTSEAVITWKGATAGDWNVLQNWAGGLPEANSTVILNHERQTNAYSVVIQSAATTDKLWLQSFSDVPIHVCVEMGGLLLLNTLRMGDKAEDRESSFTINGGTVIGQAQTTAITNTSFLIGNNPGGTATLTITNSGSLRLRGKNGLTIATRSNSTGKVSVVNANLLVESSLILAQGAGACGELIIAGAASVSITGALHIAKLDDGAISPVGIVQMMDGTLECGTLNVGSTGIGSMTLNNGNVRVLGGGVTLGLSNSTGLLTMNGGSLTTIKSCMNIGHADSSGTFFMNGGTAFIDGSITAGYSSRSFGQIDISGGNITAAGLIIGGAVSSGGEINMTGGAMTCGDSLQVGALGPGTLNLQGGLLETTNLIVGADAYGECTLIGGELRILGTDSSSMQISNGTVRIEKSLLLWNNPNVTEAISHAVETGALRWGNGLAAGTYSTNGYDGHLITEQGVLYWDNLDNGCQFTGSGIWVENPTFEDWINTFSLSVGNALWSADPDQDGLDNLFEFALGGNPTNSSPAAIPTFTLFENELEYVYRQRPDPAAFLLNYTLEQNTNLLMQTWTTNGVKIIGTTPELEGFISVTNRISTDQKPQLFIRLRIEQL